MAQHKNTKIRRNVLERHAGDYDEKLGVSLINDFLQLSRMLDELKESNPKAFHAMYALVDERMKASAKKPRLQSSTPVEYPDPSDDSDEAINQRFKASVHDPRT